MPTKQELIASELDLIELQKELDVNSILYLPEDRLKKALLDQKDHCLACFNGNYPTHYGNVRLADLK
jgi:glutamine phosphoribosylpyrophosphate amidotransferase